MMIGLFQVRRPDFSGRFPIHYAIAKIPPRLSTCPAGILACLKRYDADVVNTPVEGTGETILHLACQQGLKDLVEYLIDECDADIEAIEEGGNTPLMFACREGHAEIVRMLRERGASLRKNKSGSSPYDEAKDSVVHSALRDVPSAE